MRRAIKNFAGGAIVLGTTVWFNNIAELEAWLVSLDLPSWADEAALGVVGLATITIIPAVKKIGERVQATPDKPGTTEVAGW